MSQKMRIWLLVFLLCFSTADVYAEGMPCMVAAVSFFLINGSPIV